MNRLRPKASRPARKRRRPWWRRRKNGKGFRWFQRDATDEELRQERKRLRRDQETRRPTKEPDQKRPIGR